MVSHIRRRLALVMFLVSGCAARLAPEPVRVEIPVAVLPDLPPSLAEPIVTGPPPEFVEPSVPEARAALTEEGIRRLQTFVFDLRAAALECRAWARGQE